MSPCSCISSKRSSRVAPDDFEAVLPAGNVRGIDRYCYVQCAGGNPMNIIVVAFLDTMPEYSDVVDGLKRIMRRHWRLRAVIRNGRWCPCTINAESHLVYQTVPLTGMIEDYVSHEASRTFDMTEKLWEWQFMQGKSKNHGTDLRVCFVLRFHHCLGDGLSLVYLVQTFSPKPIDGGKVVQPSSFKRTPRPCRWLWVLTWFFWGPWVLLTMLLMRADRDHGLRQGHVAKDGHQDGSCCRCCCCSRRRPLAQKRCIWSRAYPLAELRSIGFLVGTTSVTAVTIALVSGALRDYFFSCGNAKPSDIKAIVPYSFRSSKETEMMNEMAPLFFRLPVGLDDDVTRLKKSVSNMNMIKRGPHALVAYIILKVGLAVLPMQWLLCFQDYFASKCTLVFTSVPAGEDAIFIADSLLTASYGFPPPVGDLPMCLSMFCSHGKLSFGLLVDSNLAEPERLFVFYESRLAKLKERLDILD